MPAHASGPVDSEPVASGHAEAARAPGAADIAQRFHRWLLDTPPGLDAAGPGVLDDALAQLEAVAARFDVRRMPRLPALVPQVMAAIRRDGSDAAEVAALLARDPMLAGEVLRVANSAWYRRGTGATTVQQAVQAIGHEGLRHVLVTTVMRPILRGEPSQPGFAVAGRLWAQAEACTWLCARLAVGRCDVGDAQLAGIVATAGASALLRMTSLPLLAQAAADPAFAGHFATIAWPLSARAAAHWQLPDEVRQALDERAGAGAAATPLGRVLASADLLAMGESLVDAGLAAQEDIAAVDCGLPESAAARLVLLASVRGELRAGRD